MEPSDVMVTMLPWIIGGGMALGGAAILGWIHTTRLRIKHGYPLETMWGMPIHPKRNEQTDQRVALLTQENAALQAELGAVKDRLANVERIVTDSGFHLTHEIDRLRLGKETN